MAKINSQNSPAAAAVSVVERARPLLPNLYLELSSTYGSLEDSPDRYALIPPI